MTINTIHYNANIELRILPVLVKSIVERKYSFLGNQTNSFEPSPNNAFRFSPIMRRYRKGGKYRENDYRRRDTAFIFGRKIASARKSRRTDYDDLLFTSAWRELVFVMSEYE